MKEAAAAAEEAAADAHTAISRDPRRNIRRWFSGVYYRGYYHGFFRALGYFRHHAKEGRLIRLRELWEEAHSCIEDVPPDIDVGDIRASVVRFSPKAYNEFRQLLTLSFGVKLDAKSDENVGTTGQGGSARVPGS